MAGRDGEASGRAGAARAQARPHRATAGQERGEIVYSVFAL